MKRIWGIVVIVALATLLACSSLGPQPGLPVRQPGEKRLYDYDLTKPDGPMLQMLRATQERDYEKFKASFAPTVDAARISEEAFNKFRKKVLTTKVEPVAESVQVINENEAIVKLRNGRAKEIPVHVVKVDGNWFIAEIEAGKKARQKAGAPPAEPPAEHKPAS